MSMIDILKQPTRIVTTRCTYGSTQIPADNIVSWTYDGAISGIDAPSFGNAYASSITIKFLKDSNLPSSWLDYPLKVEVGVCNQEGVTDPEAATSFNYYSLGYFYLDESTKSEDKLTVDIVGYDFLSEMMDVTYTTNLSFPATATAILDDLASYGITYETPAINPTIEYRLEGNVREVLQTIALFLGSNCTSVPAYDKKVRFINPVAAGSVMSIDGDNYETFKISGNGTSTISKLVAGEYSYGDNSGATFTLESTCISEQATLQSIYTNASLPIGWQSYKLECQGFPNLVDSLGQNITIETVEGDTHTLPIAHHVLKFNGGGLRSSINCEAIDESAGISQAYGIWYISGKVEDIEGATYGIEEAISNAEAAYNTANSIKTTVDTMDTDVDGLITSLGDMRVDLYGSENSDGKLAEIEESIATQVGELESNTNASIGNMEQRLSTVEEGVAEIAPISAYVRVVTASDGTKYLLVGNSGSPFKTKLTNEDIQFLNGDVKVAYVSHDTLEITNANIQEKLTFGNWQWKEELDGNLTLRYIG